jgi:hypothetical protein
LENLDKERVMKIKLTKFAKSNAPLFPTPEKEDYKDGKINEGISLPMDYWIIGKLLFDIEEGKAVRVLREERNGVKVPGLFSTSLVTKIDGDKFETLNSIYKIEYLDK